MTDFNESCGLQNTTCDCHDCITYFNKDVNRPIKSNDMTTEEFNELLTFCSDEKVIDLMKKERYKSYIYYKLPHPFWKKLENPIIYNDILEKVKLDKSIPDEKPEICKISRGLEIDLDNNETSVTVICYRFPTSTVKYELILKTTNDKIILKTRSRGAELKK